MPGGSELAVILLVVALLFIVPRLRQGAVTLIDEAGLGEKQLAQIRAGHPVGPCKNPVVDELLATFRARLRLRLPGLRALVVEQPGLNAAALADGTVVLWAGLVAAVEAGQVPRDELAGLLAHELAHVELGHGRQAALQELLSRPLVGRLAPGGPLGQLVLGKGMDLLRKGASREVEWEADAHALVLLRGAGLDPRGLERFLLRLKEQSPQQPEWAAWLSTHPHLDARVARLREGHRA